ncbi:xanthine dehydrogenase family protein molybdopterin-binding subunit [Yoonia sediminilitoris]|uniref:Isoquinoline 1-oxidoreductase beta subunit n=1 Tax=Yoonia sediminilitoris TaxID=1286148 RepID=A0A2T6KQM5_9RHOB|nr:molybdopterin cofactor-binding domain-containing protein [Yoonia sediminilitoris]PUB18869.1 isoquinoline 1-oxidoreductase beta subunit [Yoonia sediminilitoris]RCW99037.1 isoquinoline 1-oxidoreductase beta subunit [Yoonia sediminilitoris]
MANFRKIARRTFLIGTVAIAGGVAFGVYQVRKDAPNPLTPGEGEATLNPYILINSDGITIIAPRAEMGQGVHTTLAALVAEEMDVAWEDITVLHGPPAQAYYNQALLGLALPFRHYADTAFKHTLRQGVGMVGKLLNLQVTGGSTSTKDAYERMRHAGASAREALKLAAAAQLGTDAGSLRTENSQVIAPDGRTIAYTALAEALRDITPPDVELRDKSTWKYLGKSMPRTDMVAKSTGTAQYATDTKLDDLKFATVRMNPRRSGMVSFDDSAAKTMAGVEQIIDLEDGIAVVANNTWLALQAANAVEITWEDASYPADTAALLAAVEASFKEEPNSVIRDDGDVTAPVDGTEITATYQVPYLAHSTMEPMCATALYTDDGLEIWAGNQAPVIVRDKCAEAVGLTPEQVMVHTTLMGGGFGRRSEYDFSVQAAKIAKAMPGTPIRMTWPREEDMTHDFYRPAAMAQFRGFVADGEAQLVDGKIAAQSVTHNSSRRLAGQIPPGPDRGHVEGAADQPYAIPNFRVSGHLTDLTVPLGFWRSVGNSHNGFFFDTFIDEMAHAAKVDPLQFRLKMARAEHAPSAGVIQAVYEMSGWTGNTPDNIGRGVAFTYSFGTPVAEVVEVEDTGNGIRINKCWIACDVGTALDPRIIESQMVSGAIYGFSAAMQGEITFADGAAEQRNFYDYDAMRMHNTPAFEVRILETAPFMGGVGEPGTPPSMPALGNALFDLTGTRARTLPLNKTFDLIL